MPLNPPLDDALPRRLQERLPAVLPGFLRAQRWFGGKAHTIRSVSVSEVVPIRAEGLSAYVLLISVEYTAGHSQNYALPLIPAPAPSVESGFAGSESPVLELAREGQEPPYLLRDALYDARFAQLLIESIGREDKFPGAAGAIVTTPGLAFDSLWNREEGVPEPSVMKGEQSNTSVRYGERLILKFYRRIEEGVNLDQEIGRFLTEKAHFKYTPPLAGAIQYQRPGRPSVTLAILQGFVRNHGDAWQYTLQALDQFLGDARRRRLWQGGFPQLPSLDQINSSTPNLGMELSPYLRTVELLGRRTGELHLALASGLADPGFAPEAFSADYLRSVAESMVRLAESTLQLLRERVESLPSSSRQKADRVLAQREQIVSRLRRVADLGAPGMRMRIHGDYHLGQVLVTEGDFAIIDFEGEPERPLSERRLKRSPLRDVAGMLRSFCYAASTALKNSLSETGGGSQGQEALGSWAQGWRTWVSEAFLRAYRHEVAIAPFIPPQKASVMELLGIFSLEKAIYELAYELKNRPDWVEIPLDGILELP